MRKTRKMQEPGHKAKVALEAERERKMMSELAAQFALHPSQIQQWKRTQTGVGQRVHRTLMANREIREHLPQGLSPLRKGDEIEVLEMTPKDECQHEMFVGIRREKRPLGVPLAQLKPIQHTDKGTKEAVADWYYWVAPCTWSNFCIGVFPACRLS
jgi:hypothetical protein